METRKMMLPEGWYPKTYKSAESMINSWEIISAPEFEEAVGGIGPHAGWSYSGELSWKIVNNIPPETDCIIIAGGHLLPGHQHRVLDYHSFETPFGPLKLDIDAKNSLCNNFIKDNEPDNTVEIYLPLIKYRFPDVKILPLRLSPSEDAISWAKRCASYFQEHNLKAFFLGSTDLSHYGYRFNYTKFGDGRMAQKKIYEIDHAFLEKLKTYDLEKALCDIQNNQCACSGGAAVGAGIFSFEYGKGRSTILDHYYSYDIAADDNFVGYGALIYS